MVRIHVGKQQADTITTRKVKALKVRWADNENNAEEDTMDTNEN